MGQVIQMFKQEPDPTEPFVLSELLTPEMEATLVDLGSQIEEVWEATSERDFQDRVRALKDAVSELPSG